MDTTQHVHEQTDPQQAEQLAQTKLSQACDAAGLNLSFPAETSDVLEFFTALDYRINGDFVFGLLENKTLLVPMVGGKRQWDALSVWALWGQLEGRRRWKPTSRHIHKMSALERMQLLSEQGEGQGLHDLDSFDVEQLVFLLEDAESRDARHCLRIALLSKLRQEGSL